MRGRVMLTVAGLLMTPLALAGCSTTSKCSGLTCTVKIAKPGQSTTVGGTKETYRDRKGKRRTRTRGGTSFRLVSVAGGTAQLQVGGQPVSCRQGESVQTLSANLTCTQVGPGVSLNAQLRR